MKKDIYFEMNLLALSPSNPELCRTLSASETTKGRYSFLEARDGSTVPALRCADGSSRPLHSLVAPKREAARLVSTVKTDAFLILYGLGGGFVAEAALERDDIQGVLVVEFDSHGVAELMANIDLVRVLGDSRTVLLVNPTSAQISSAIMDRYRPVFSGGLVGLPLRSRTELAQGEFNTAAASVGRCLEAIGDDYGAQAYFGKRWFSNAVRNLTAAAEPTSPFRCPHEVVVTAAGPSLEAQLDELGVGAAPNSPFILATDTTVPALLQRGIVPQAVVSIDCQHISYYHFMTKLPEEVPIFLDLASPPVIASGRKNIHFFAGGHPFTVYLARKWRSFPFLDTSGGNVTHTAVALADRLGARRIRLLGADFSYPEGKAYARGTYIYPFFARIATRHEPLESSMAAFIFRNEKLDQELDERGRRYVTKPLSSYRERLEGLAVRLKATLAPAPGAGAIISVPDREEQGQQQLRTIESFSAGSCNASVFSFLKEFRDAVFALPAMEEAPYRYMQALDEWQRDVFTTLLPAAAAIRRIKGLDMASELLEETKRYCTSELDRVIDATN